MGSEAKDICPKGMIYTDPFSFEKICYNFPSFSDSDFPTISWIFGVIFGNTLEDLKESSLGLRMGSHHISYKKHGSDSLLKYLPLGRSASFIEPKVTFSLFGGKGGFGSMLRAQGGRMNSKKSTNNDACRDLSGRRLKTVRTAEKLAQYQEGEAERAKVQKEQREKRIAKKLKVPVKRKILFDDNEYLEQSEQLRLDMRSAVSQAVSSQAASSSKSPSKRTASIFDDELSSDSDESASGEASDSDEASGSDQASDSGDSSTQESESEEPQAIGSPDADEKLNEASESTEDNKSN